MCSQYPQSPSSPCSSRSSTLSQRMHLSYVRPEPHLAQASSSTMNASCQHWGHCPIGASPPSLIARWLSKMLHCSRAAATKSSASAVLPQDLHSITKSSSEHVGSVGR